MSATVMIVDDSAMVRMQVRRALTDAGFAVEDAIDGEDAWLKLQDAHPVGLLVCDMNMPRMNGLELLERMSQSPTLAGLPVLMLTTEGQPELIQRARGLGAKGWIVKPFKPEMLVAAARKITGRSA